MPNKNPAQEIIGEAYTQLKKRVAKYAKNKIPVLFVGERGTGKDLLARYYAEKAGNKRFAPINCAGVSDYNTLASEIFGHKRGSFSGATDNRPGKLYEFRDGVVLLDELGDASENLQAALLRAVEYKEFFPFGSDKIINSDVLIIAATNRPHQLRPDLRDRFRSIPIPPLQKRDIPILAKHFLGKQLRKEYLEILMAGDYPGNVRELEKTCDDLRIKEGIKIFDNKGSGIGTPWHFEYQRYKTELETWNKRIQPLLDLHGPKELKYEYMDWDPNWMLMDIENKDKDISKAVSAKHLVYGYPPDFPFKRSEKSRMYYHGTLDLIAWLDSGAQDENELPPLGELAEGVLEVEGKDVDVIDTILEPSKIKPSEVVPNFRKHMKEYFQKRVLPYLLQELNWKINHPSASPLELSKPVLSPLLDLPMNEAVTRFQIGYMEYQLHKTDGDVSQAATESGLKSKRAFEGREERARENLNKIKSS